MAKLLITYTKSAIGYSKDQKETVRSLGLRKLNSVVLQNDTPSIRGMIFKIKHLVKVEEVANDTPAPKRRNPAARPTIIAPQAGEATPAPKPAPAPRAEPAPKAEAAPAPKAEPAPTAAAEPEAAPAPSAPETEPSAPDAADDLTIVEGIGPKIAGVLNDAGIHSFADLAATDVERLSEILAAANLRLAAPDTWPEQAGLAAAGDLDGLKALQDQLKGGRREE